MQDYFLPIITINNIYVVILCQLTLSLFLNYDESELIIYDLSQTNRKKTITADRLCV